MHYKVSIFTSTYFLLSYLSNIIVHTVGHEKIFKVPSSDSQILDEETNCKMLSSVSNILSEPSLQFIIAEFRTSLLCRVENAKFMIIFLSSLRDSMTGETAPFLSRVYNYNSLMLSLARCLPSNYLTSLNYTFFSVWGVLNEVNPKKDLASRVCLCIFVLHVA